jgi:hypothetical protein
VRKFVLGRGLGALLSGARGDKSPAEDARSAPNGNEGPEPSGLDLLLQGRAPDQPAPSGIRASPSHLARKIEISLLKLSLFSADFFLVAQATLFVFKNPKPLGFWETSFCVISVGLGAWLSFLAVLLDSRPPK